MMQGKRIAENLEEAYLYTAGEGGISAAEAIGRAVRAAAVAAEHDDKSRELYEQLVEVENLIGDSGRELAVIWTVFPLNRNSSMRRRAG